MAKAEQCLEVMDIEQDPINAVVSSLEVVVVAVVVALMLRELSYL